MLRFENPLWWLALIPLVPFLVWRLRKSYADLPPARARLSLVLRIAALLLIIAAVTRPLWMLSNSDRAVLYLLDVSESSDTQALEAGWTKILGETKELGSGQSAGLVLFAGEARLSLPVEHKAFVADPLLVDRVFHRREKERVETRIKELERSELGETERKELDLLRPRREAIERWERELHTDDTDIESALRLARGCLPADARGRVVLLSDGRATRGDALREIAELRRSGVLLDARALEAPARPEVVAEALRAPTEVQVKAPFDLELSLRSNFTGPATVRIFRNKYLVAEKPIELVLGENLLTLPHLTLEEGLHEFEARVSAASDSEPENNVARAAVRVTGKPKVLLCEHDLATARHLEEALATDEIQVDLRPETGVPTELNDLLAFDVLILSDVPSSAMTQAQMELVRRYVKEFGGGLVMIGGEHSFGLGGYYRTPIEDALPVKMPIKKNVEKPNLALMLVIDKSGSMTGSGKLEIAKEAAIAAAEVLKPSDKFGVNCFDSLPEWICHLTDASDIESIRGQIARIYAGGGTNIYPALYEAYQELLNADAKLKHIIVLTDGVTEGSGYDELVSHIAADEITLSTVGIGDDADVKFLQEMARNGGGECYLTSDFASIPQILTKETLRASKSMLIEEPFVPKLAAPSEILRGVDTASMPMLLGYVATQAKDTATVALLSDYHDPVLASWGYGLGRSVAFTSDAKAHWAGDWIGWEHFTKFWAQLVRSTMSTGAHKELQTRSRVVIQGGEARVTLDVRGRSGEFRDDVQPEVNLVEASGPRSLGVTHLAPGLFEASFPVEKVGEFQRLILVQKQKGEIVDLRALAAAQSYSAEFSKAPADMAFLELAAREAGGKLEPLAADLWNFSGDPARTPRETWWWWLLIACLLLPIDIAVRRVGI